MKSKTNVLAAAAFLGALIDDLGLIDSALASTSASAETRPSLAVNSCVRQDWRTTEQKEQKPRI